MDAFGVLDAGLHQTKQSVVSSVVSWTLMVFDVQLDGEEPVVLVEKVLGTSVTWQPDTTEEGWG